MELDLFLGIESDVIICVFMAIAVMVVIIALAKTSVALESLGKKKKEVGNDDVRGDKKRVTKANVHKSR